MAGRPLEAMALVGLGAENFSITPAGVGSIKAMVRSLDAAAIRSRMDELVTQRESTQPKEREVSLRAPFWSEDGKHAFVVVR